MRHTPYVKTIRGRDRWSAAGERHGRQSPLGGGVLDFQPREISKAGECRVLEVCSGRW